MDKGYTVRNQYDDGPQPRRIRITSSTYIAMQTQAGKQQGYKPLQQEANHKNVRGTIPLRVLFLQDQ
jgi:hypothetical protein